ncbi:MAG: hypothetical protein JW751_06400 [Polyangiaceae bacterium]|nr:hypothetical protein [Polyangiaceae bacterium]
MAQRALRPRTVIIGLSTVLSLGACGQILGVSDYEVESGEDEHGGEPPGGAGPGDGGATTGGHGGAEEGGRAGMPSGGETLPVPQAGEGGEGGGVVSTGGGGEGGVPAAGAGGGSTGGLGGTIDIGIICEDACGDESDRTGYVGDGACDDGAFGHDYAVCTFGTDCTDCGPRQRRCEDTCAWPDDGECDDGGPDALNNVCDFGTDCTDCGMRTGVECDPFNPEPGCGEGRVCVPQRGDGSLATCTDLVGTQSAYGYCWQNSDCVAGTTCLFWSDAESPICLTTCRLGYTDCPNAGEECVDLTYGLFIGDEEWGVCMPPVGAAPPGWTCDAGLWFDATPDCDCGCGVFDPDCVGPTSEYCTWCGDAGSCAGEGTFCADSVIAPDDNAVCIEPSGTGGTGGAGGASGGTP